MPAEDEETVNLASLCKGFHNLGVAVEMASLTSPPSVPLKVMGV